VTGSDTDLSEEIARRLIERIRTFADESLRGAIYYDESRREVLHIREDVAEQYSDAEIETAIEDLALEAFGDPTRLTDLYQMGELRATTRWFEDGILVHYPFSDVSGVAISFGHDIGTELNTVLSVGTAYLDGQ
jgi:hypothetical protein